MVGEGLSQGYTLAQTAVQAWSAGDPDPVEDPDHAVTLRSFTSASNSFVRRRLERPTLWAPACNPASLAPYGQTKLADFDVPGRKM